MDEIYIEKYIPSFDCITVIITIICNYNTTKYTLPFVGAYVNLNYEF
jgi:hypothetical protein